MEMIKHYIISDDHSAATFEFMLFWRFGGASLMWRYVW